MLNTRLNKPGLNKFIPVDPITIKEPLNKETKQFENTDEFTVFYRQNESLFKDPVKNKHLSANLLNRLYTVPGYKISITKRNTDNEELILIKDYRSKYANVPLAANPYGLAKQEVAIEQMDNLNEELIQSLMNKVNVLSTRLDNIESFLTQLK